ncbi:hypothetical protein G5714_001552 [Onychostoma macrolepis]|uniref:G-protein coupled receptors family 1 profile domain-containing protein n=1 Tax=Onychostoma macrolepis TaxID=369639 RepID=A0A7J6DCP9_9TELE|nr:hypothetical protein G5714_001552 [Onychostoma macrolepis]
MTEEPGTGAAPTADYSDYYDIYESEIGAPCGDVNTQAFSKVLVPILYSTVLIVGLLGNAVVLCVLIRSRHRCSLTDVCLLNLAVSDLLFLASLPVWTHSAVDEWVLGTFVCHTVTGLFTTGLYSSVFFMVLVTLDRHVIAALQTQHLFQKTACKSSSGLICMDAQPVCVPP